MGFKIGIIRTAKNNPIRFLIASVFSLCVVCVSTLGLVWILYTTYALGIAKNIFSKSTDSAIEIGTFRYEIRTAEFVFENVSLYNPSNFEVKNLTSNTNLKEIQPHMLKLSELRVKADFLSVLKNDPKISKAKIVISEINAIRITPKLFNLLMFIEKLSEHISVSENGIKNFAFVIEKSSSKKNENITYVDFSSKKDVIVLNRNESFKFERSNIENVKNTLKELSAELSAKTQLQFVARALNNFLE